MPFRLDITFAGMCMLVRDSDAASNPRMLHLLMPETHAGTHLPTVAYRTEYEPASTNPQPVTKHHVAGKQLLGLASLTGSNGFGLAMPPDVFDFERPPLGQRQVPRTLLDGAALPAGVVFRARLRAGVSVEHNKGGFWFVRVGATETVHTMATAVDWKIEGVREASLTLDLGGGLRPVLVPRPDASGQLAIHVMIVNLTPDERARLGRTVLPPTVCLPQRRPGDHFPHYYPLLRPAPPNVVPEFNRTRTKGEGRCVDPMTDAGEPDEAGTGTPGAYDDRRPDAARSPQPPAVPLLLIGSEFTCMVTTATAVP